MRNLDDVSILFDFEYTKDDAEIRMLGQLKSLDVACLPKLVHITRMFPKGICIFKNLTRLKVKGCDNLRYLFSPSMANSLVALEGLRVENCKAIEEIIGTQEEDNTSNIEIVEEGTTSRIVFPKLRRLKLLHLDRFKLLSSQNHELLLPSLEHLRIAHCLSLKSLFSELSCTVNSMHNPLFKQVTLSNLEILEIDGLDCTVTILDELRQIGSQKLRALTIANLDNVSIVFDTKDDAEIRILGQITLLAVVFLPKLVHITRMFRKGICIFKNLTYLLVERCDNLRYLFSPSMANSLVALKDVLVENCEAIEEIIGRQEEDNTSNIEIVEEGTTSKIVFPKLRRLKLFQLDRFRLLSSQNYELVLPSLVYLCIENCPMMTKLCPRRLLSAPKLDKVWINDDQSIDISNFLDFEDVREPQIC